MIWTHLGQDQRILGKSNGRKVERSELKFQELLAAVETESSRTHLEEFAEQWGLSWKPREVML